LRASERSQLLEALDNLSEVGKEKREKKALLLSWTNALVVID